LKKITLEETRWWYYAKSADDASSSVGSTSGTPLSVNDLENSSMVAKYLVTTYTNYYWYRT
jgi:hypothetical protein